jgi:hypothetical protein
MTIPDVLSEEVVRRASAGNESWGDGDGSRREITMIRRKWLTEYKVRRLTGRSGGRACGERERGQKNCAALRLEVQDLEVLDELVDLRETNKNSKTRTSE